VISAESRFRLQAAKALPRGLSEHGINEDFPTTPPVSLYGVTKLASEQLAFEYAHAFDFPVHVNRCGVLAGPGQFGKADQGIFSYWIHSWLAKRPLHFIGFNGLGHQVRDALHPRDLVPLLRAQMANPQVNQSAVINVGGGIGNSMSLAELSAWCADRLGPADIGRNREPRPFDAPWVVMDSRKAEALWNWKPKTHLSSLLDEIVHHAREHPQWLDLCS
jgi:CDP-paratose 2-epimerase